MIISLTSKEKEFLRQYALKFDQERAVDITADPIVVVENERLVVTERGHEDKIIYSWDEKDYDTLEELKEDLEENDFSESEILHIMTDLEDRGHALGMEIKELHVLASREPVAYFLTREEAFKYVNYQKHNLASPRVYTRSVGHNNGGDLACLMKLLLKMGNILIERENNQKEAKDQIVFENHGDNEEQYAKQEEDLNGAK